MSTTQDDDPIVIDGGLASNPSYHKLILTDLEQSKVTNPNDWKQVKLWKETNTHLKTLCDNGAKGPYYGVSGFEGDGKQFTAFNKITCRGQLLKFGLVAWGSPHWGEVCVDESTRNWLDSSMFKTNSWESINWLSGASMNIMTFAEKYKVEFWGPTYNKDADTVQDTRQPRQIIIGRGFFQKVPSAWQREQIRRVVARSQSHGSTRSADKVSTSRGAQRG